MSWAEYRQWLEQKGYARLEGKAPKGGERDARVVVMTDWRSPRLRLQEAMSNA